MPRILILENEARVGSRVQMLDVRIRDNLCLKAACIRSFFFFCKSTKKAVFLQLGQVPAAAQGILTPLRRAKNENSHFKKWSFNSEDQNV